MHANHLLVIEIEAETVRLHSSCAGSDQPDRLKLRGILFCDHDDEIYRPPILLARRAKLEGRPPVAAGCVPVAEAWKQLC